MCTKGKHDISGRVLQFEKCLMRHLNCMEEQLSEPLEHDYKEDIDL